MKLPSSFCVEKSRSSNPRSRPLSAQTLRSRLGSRHPRGLSAAPTAAVPQLLSSRRAALRTPLLKDVKWLQSITSLPILVKGVITVEHVRLSVESGAAGIIVSNHGARQLDYVPATITALEEVVKSAQGKVPVFLDGGVRRGTDVFKALALGAVGVFIGRPVLFSLAAEGEAGVRKALQMLRHEFELTRL